MLEPLATVTLCCKHHKPALKSHLNGSIQMNHGSENMRKCTLDLENGCCVLWSQVAAQQVAPSYYYVISHSNSNWLNFKFQFVCLHLFLGLSAFWGL